MRVFSRALARWEMPRVAATALGIALLVLLAAFLIAAVTVQPDAKSVGAALFVLGIAGFCILYAWREPAA